MKISFRILLINFVIVALIIISSTIAFYTLTKKIILFQNTKVLSNSVSDFSLAFGSVLQDTESDFLDLVAAGRLSGDRKISGDIDAAKCKADFIFTINPDSSLNPDFFFFKPSIISSGVIDFNSFVLNNPGALIKEYRNRQGITYFFGRIITEDLLDNLSKKIRADVAVFSDNIPVVYSNSEKNQDIIGHLIRAISESSESNTKKQDIITLELDDLDLYASTILLNKYGFKNPGKQFLIFYALPEAAELRNSISQLVLIIGITGIALSLVLVLIFTDKIRKQVMQLSKAAEIIKSGNILHRVEILSKDELGQLGTAFNNMLDEIVIKEAAKNEYTEFISLINQNPSLTEAAEAAINKIVEAANVTVGQLYLVIDDSVKLLTSYGISRELMLSKDKIDLFEQVIKKGESVEFNFDKYSPKINTGLVEIELKHILIFPVIYNKKVIAVIELGSVNMPEKNIKAYLENIHDQLAIGLTNANALRQLENFVKELKVLNENYQKQNEQVTKQNEKLVELHKQLKEKAEELEVQKEKAVESTVLKSQFLATVSHELRTPLSSILGLTELVLGDKSITQQNKEKLKVVLRNGNRLINLINDILEFTKIEAGKTEIIKDDFRLKDLISDVEIQISPLILSKNVNFVIHNELETGLVINSDRDKITHILVNLLGNAVKFTEEGMVILKSRMPEENTIQFEIIDSGIGISEKDLKIIFEEFRQVDSTSTRKYSGAGLGLTICKRYADALNGTISAKSELGKGSVFVFSLPVEIVKESEIIDPNQLSLNLFEKEASNEQSGVPSEKTVLVIDGNIDNQKIVGQYLISKNYSVVYAADYEEGINKISEKTPYAITLNTLSLDRGWELLKLLKERPETQHIPVIPLIFYDELNLGYGLQVCDYITKPVEISLLQNCLNKFEKLTGLNSINILVVDDDIDFCQKLSREFSSENIKLNFEENGAAAFKTVLRLQPDLIIADILMDRADGISLVHQLKDTTETKDIYVLLTIPETLSEKELFQLNHNLEKAALKSKRHKIDVLKVIRDRLHFEEGIPLEDTSAIWIDSKPDNVEIHENAIYTKSKSKRMDKPKVLIVDDDTDTLFTVGEIVRKAGCDIVFAKNGLECLSSLQMLTPDLILLDIMMPRMDGFETIKRIRSDNTLSDIPVFALTAQAMIEEKDVIIRNGFDDFICKPVNPGALIHKIENVVHKIINI